MKLEVGQTVWLRVRSDGIPYNEFEIPAAHSRLLLCELMSRSPCAPPPGETLSLPQHVIYLFNVPTIWLKDSNSKYFLWKITSKNLDTHVLISQDATCIKCGNLCKQTCHL
jgi:hypothetical protein